MTWLKIDDGFLSHPKAFGLKDGPLALWVRAGLWAARELTDGRVPQHVLKGLNAKPAHIAELVRRGLWRTESDGVSFHDWLDYQPSRDQTLNKRSKTLQRVRKHRNAVTNGVSNAGETPLPIPIPIPIPDQISSSADQRSETLLVPSSRARDPLKPPIKAEPGRAAARVWSLHLEARGLSPLNFPSLGIHEAACRAIAEWADRTGGDFDAAVRGLLRAWNADLWVKEKRPDLGHLAKRIEKYAPTCSRLEKAGSASAPKNTTPEYIQIWEAQERRENALRRRYFRETGMMLLGPTDDYERECEQRDNANRASSVAG